jgi:hypothetical protein
MGSGMATDVRRAALIQKSVVFALFLRELKTRFACMFGSVGCCSSRWRMSLC